MLEKALAIEPDRTIVRYRSILFRQAAKRALLMQCNMGNSNDDCLFDAMPQFMPIA
jgi:hypothetical protein